MLPYDVAYSFSGYTGCDYTMNKISQTAVDEAFPIEEIKPYLRPMSSMTKEECKDFYERYEIYFGSGGNATSFTVYDYLIMDFGYSYDMPISDMFDMLQWLYYHHFDVNHLIEKGLALEAPKEMYKTE